jgi:hypothetical protein
MQNTGIITPARKTLVFETNTATKKARTPLSERSMDDFDINDNKENNVSAFGAAFLQMAMHGKIKTRRRGNEEEEDATLTKQQRAMMMEQMQHELAQARAEIAILKERERELLSMKSPTMKTKNATKSSSIKSPLLLPSPPMLETPMRFRRERDSFRKELKMISQNAEMNETKMLEAKNREQKLSQENEAWLLKALNEKTRALKIAAKANNASEKELSQAKETASILERSLREQTEKVHVLKQRLVKNEQARKKLESKVGRYRDALKDASLRNVGNGEHLHEEAMPQESIDTAMSNESYCGENKVEIDVDDNVGETKEDAKEEEEEEEVNFRVFPEQMMMDPNNIGVPATPAMFQFPRNNMINKNSNDDEYEANRTTTTDVSIPTTPGGEVIDFYGRPKRDTKKDVFVIFSVWVATIVALISMGTSSTVSSVVGERVVVKGFGFFC